MSCQARDRVLVRASFFEETSAFSFRFSKRRMSLADKSMKSSERFSVGLFSRDRPVHRSREETDDPLVKERVERVRGTFRFSILGRENVVCSRTPAVDRLREERAKKEIVFRYTAPDGETVAIPRIVEPYKFLHVNQNASRAEIKSAFLRVANHSQRQDRAMASLSYNILMSKIPRYRQIRDDRFEVTQRTDVIVLAVAGATASLVSQISKNSSLASTTDEYKHSLLYVTARSGFYDTTEALLEMGVPVNEKQVDGSTALHAASFYGQQPVVELLLRHGADPTVTNKWRHSPADEANSREIKQIILSYKEDRISQIVSSLVGKSLAFWVRLIKYNGTVIAKEVLRNRNVIDPRTRQELDSIISNWKSVWHGTKAEHLESILRHGLKPSGSKLPGGFTISPPLNHIKLEKKCFGIDNWANAVFVSPRITYASHSAYSERISSVNKKWCVLIRAYVKPGTYTRHQSTVSSGADPIPGESVMPEYRIDDDLEEEEIFFVKSGLAGTEGGTEFDRNVVVTSVVFISLAFLEKTPNLTVELLKSLFENEQVS